MFEKGKIRIHANGTGKYAISRSYGQTVQLSIQ
jgi:hypothetical protein